LGENLQELKRQLEIERHVSSAFSELSKAIISPLLTNSDIYQMVLDQARELTDSEHGFVSSIDTDSGAHISHTLTKMKSDGCQAPLKGGVLPEGPHKTYGSLWGNGLNTREAFFTNNPSSHPSSRGLPEGHVPMKNFLSVPVAFHGLLLGQIALANSTRDYCQDDIEIIEKLSVFYAVVLRNHIWAQEMNVFNEKLTQLATIDGLTGVYNRRHFLLCAEEEFRRINRYGGACSLLMLDIDRFKKVNDTFGHAVGDAAIHRVAELCAESLRSTDLLGRIGGEEFAMLLIETGIAEAALVAERLRLRIQDDAFGVEMDIFCPLRVSIGVAERQSQESETLAALMSRADEALYRAKKEGRNKVVIT